MKNTCISGRPRKQGNTAKILEEFVGWAYSLTINRTFKGLPKFFDFSNLQANLRLLFVY